MNQTLFSIIISSNVDIFKTILYIHPEKKEEPRFSMKRKICNYKIKEVKIL